MILQVKARNHGGTETTYAGLGSTVTRAAVPQALAYSDVSTGTLKANWTKNSNPEGTLYTVELDDDSQFSSIAFTSVTIAGWAQFFNLGVNTSYYARVRAENWARTVTGWTQLGSTSTRANVPESLVSTFSAVYFTSVTFSWSAGGNPDATLYVAEISTKTDFIPLVSSLQTTQTTAALTGLMANSTSYARVKARSHSGVDTDYLSLGSTVTMVLAPGASVYSQVAADSLRINWHTAANAPGAFYIAEIDDAEEFGSINQTSATYNTYAQMTGLSVNTTYYSRVRAENWTGSVSSYTIIGATATLVNMPASLVSTFTLIASTSFTFQWNNNNNPSDTLYVAELSSASSFGFISGSSRTRQTQAAVTNLKPNTDYYFRVKAVNHQGIPSNVLNLGSKLSLAAVPAGHPVSTFTSVGPNHVTFRWTANDNPLGTNYLSEISSSSSFLTLANSSITATLDVAMVGLLPNTTYFTRVKARNFGGTETPYAEFGSTVTLAAAPAAAADPFPSVNFSSITLRWLDNGNSPGTLYIAEISTHDNFSASVISSQTIETTIGYAGLLSNTTYYARVKARGHDGRESDYLDLTSTATLTAAPAAGAGFSNLSATGFRIAWSDNGNSPDTPYNVQIDDNFNFSSIVQSAITTNTYNDFSGLGINTIYYARVQSLNRIGSGSFFAELGSTCTLTLPPISHTSTFSAVGSNGLAFQWQDNGNPPATVFVAETSSSDSFSFISDSEITTLTQASFSSLTSNTTYYVQVKSRNQSGSDSEYVGLGSTITLARPPLSHTSTFTAVNVSSLTFQWQANANPDNTLYIAEISSFVGLSPLTGSSATVLTQAAFFD
ncbi:MAG: fibronectin type III domain-containing protein, partial [Elusimicrobia bacterium]|nr:fibronectin type III domain-containing protein [Elusimicrobiota bacterium]